MRIAWAPPHGDGANATSCPRARSPSTHACGSPFGALEDQVRRNMEMFERAFAMFTPFARREGQPPGEADKSNAQAGGSGDEIHELKRQMDEMQKRLDRLSDKDKT